MPRGKRKSDNENTATRTNGFDEKRAKEVVDRLENLSEQIRDINAAKASEVAVIRQDMGEVYKEAKAAWGIPSAILKLKLKQRDNDRKLREAVAKLDSDAQFSWESLGVALGEQAELPLDGAAASNGAERLAGLSTLAPDDAAALDSAAA
jgi:uncharacterized protein (UPF0335 family)